MKISKETKEFLELFIYPWIVFSAIFAYSLIQLRQNSHTPSNIWSTIIASFLFVVFTYWAIMGILGERDYIKRGKLAAKQLAYLNDGNPTIRVEAIERLRELRHDSALSILANSLHDLEPDVRVATIEALVAISEYQVIDELVGVLHYDQDPDVRWVALQNLAIISKKAFDEARKPVGGNIEASLEAAGLEKLLSTLLIPALSRALFSEDDELRETALLALSHIVEPNILDAIRKVTLPEHSTSVEFTAYYPHQVNTETEYLLFIYAHLPGEYKLPETDVSSLSQGEVDLFDTKTSKVITKIKPGTNITVVAESNQIELEPSHQTMQWNGSWIHLSFKFKPARRLAGRNLNIRISIQVGGIEISNLKIEIMVLKKYENPLKDQLAMAKLNSQTAGIYQKIFVSYSRDDSEVIELYRIAQLALGNDVFIDTYSIRTGENWRVALAHAIDTADVFQLFWSKNSALSSNVHSEWDYALRYRCPKSRCVDFIRPVYWTKPMPPPPEELSHINFRYIPLGKAIQKSEI